MLQELGFKVSDQARTDPTAAEPRYSAEIAARPDHAVLGIAVLRSLSTGGLSAGKHRPLRTRPVDIRAFHVADSGGIRICSCIARSGIGSTAARPGAFRYDRGAMDQLGKSCSMQERRAEDATRHAEARYKCAYMQDRVGDVLPGIVTGVTHFGLFVTLDGLFIDGLVHVTTLGNDYYHAEHGGLRLTGERTGASFGLGDAVNVRVVRVDTDEAKLDLELVDDGVDKDFDGARRSGRGRGRRHGRGKGRRR